MKKQNLAIIAFFTIFASGRHRAQKVNADLKKEYEKVLILSSGGTMGLAWQLATLQKYNSTGKLDLPSYDLAIGTSAGSIAALMLGSEKDVGQITIDLSLFSSVLEQELQSNTQGMFTSKNYKRALNSFKGLKFPHFGMLLSSTLHEGKNNLYSLESYINDSLRNAWPERETWVIVSDVENGRREILHRGSGLNPGTAAIASSAVPALFKSIPHGEKRYIDGGMISSSHIDIALRVRAKEITLLTISQGFANPLATKNLLSALNAVNQNIEELNIIKAKIWARFTKTKITIIRPTKNENKILRAHRLMDSTLLNKLVAETLAG
jgi:NTE family protein